MKRALAQAVLAAERDEVPVGAALVGPDGALLAEGHNEILLRSDPTAHAERLVITEACRLLGVPRLPRGCLLAVTLEPCAMCAGALVLARLDQLVFGALDPKTGACGSLRDVVRDPRLNHRIEVLPGHLSEACGELLRAFFQARRKPR
jgi:tRNA(adenine34) deaminase